MDVSEKVRLLKNRAEGAKNLWEVSSMELRLFYLDDMSKLIKEIEKDLNEFHDNRG